MYATRILQIFVVLCLINLITGDIHRIVLKRERGRNRNHKKRYIREHRKKSPYRTHHYSPTYVSHVEDQPSPHDFANHFYKQTPYFTNNYQEQSNWDTFTESNNDFYKKYQFPASVTSDPYTKQQNIADLIDLTTSSPSRIPASILSAGDFGYATLQSTEIPLEYVNDANKLVKKRKKNYGNYEVFEATDDGSHHNHNLNIQKTAATDAYQSYSPTDTSKYGLFVQSHHHMSSSPVASSSSSSSSSSSYGKRKKIKKPKRRSH